MFETDLIFEKPERRKNRTGENSASSGLGVWLLFQTQSLVLSFHHVHWFISFNFLHERIYSIQGSTGYYSTSLYGLLILIKSTVIGKAGNQGAS